MIDILYITFNRIDYTMKTLPAMIENAGVDFSLTIIDNGSTDGTVEYLNKMKTKYGNVISKIIFNSMNRGLPVPTNVFWKTSKAKFIGKVDNDTLLPKNWLARLLDAHLKCDRLGVIGGFHFHLDYVDLSAIEKRVVSLDDVQIVPDAFIGGCCYLFRKSVQERFGFLAVTPGRKTFGWTEYQTNLSMNGYVNGYIYPLLLVEHFDDPMSKHNLAFTKHLAVSQISMGDKDIELDRKKQLAWYVKDAKRVESGASLLRFGLPLRP